MRACNNMQQTNTTNTNTHTNRLNVQAVYMTTTVPQNIKGTNIMGSHTPTRSSLRHSRMLVINKNYQGKSHMDSHRGILLFFFYIFFASLFYFSHTYFYFCACCRATENCVLVLFIFLRLFLTFCIHVNSCTENIFDSMLLVVGRRRRWRRPWWGRHFGIFH